MSEENDKPARKVPVRSQVKSSRGSAKSRSRGARPTQGGGQSKVILAVVLTVVVIVGAAFGLGVFDGEKPKKTPEVTAPPKKSVSDSAFDASKNKKKKRQRVTGREPKSKDMKKITKHLGHLYIDDVLAKDIKDLDAEVKRFRRERWDISKELLAKYRSVLARVDVAKGHPFLSGADDELKLFNDFTRRREVHLKGADNNLLPEPFIGVAHEPFVFMVQAHKDGGEKKIADEVYDWMVQLKAEFVRYFTGTLKLEPSARHNRITIVLFRKYKDYANYNRIKNPERDVTFNLAHYEPDNRRLCVPIDFGAMGGVGRDPKHAFREVMFHEGTHQVMHYFTNKSHLSAYGAMWSDEGVAEYFAGHSIDPDTGKIHFGKINTRISAVARDHKDPKARITMVELLTWTRFKMEDARKDGPEKKAIAERIHSHIYSQGWALVYFFNNFKNGKYKPKFLEIMRRQVEDGDTGLPIWRRVFNSEAAYDKIEVEYFDYLDKLTDAYNDKKIKNHILVQ